jgi:hypothetical protein
MKDSQEFPISRTRSKQHKEIEPSEREKLNSSHQRRIVRQDITHPPSSTAVEITAIVRDRTNKLAAQSIHDLRATIEQAKTDIARQFDKIIEKISRGEINFSVVSKYIQEKYKSNLANNLEDNLNSLQQLEAMIDNYRDRKQRIESDNSHTSGCITDGMMNTHQDLKQKSDSQEFTMVWRYFYDMSPPERQLFNEGWEVTPRPITVNEKKGFKREMKVSRWRDMPTALALDRQAPNHPEPVLHKLIRHETEKLLNGPIITHLEEKLRKRPNDPENTVCKQILEYLDTGEQPANCEFQIETYYPDFNDKLQRLRAGTREEEKDIDSTLELTLEGKKETYVTTESVSLWTKFTNKENTGDSDGMRMLNMRKFNNVLMGDCPQDMVIPEFNEKRNKTAQWSSTEALIKEDFIIGLDYRSKTTPGVYIIADKRNNKTRILRISNQNGKLSQLFGTTRAAIDGALKGHSRFYIPEGIKVYAWQDSKGEDLLD